MKLKQLIKQLKSFEKQYGESEVLFDCEIGEVEILDIFEMGGKIYLSEMDDKKVQNALRELVEKIKKE